MTVVEEPLVVAEDLRRVLRDAVRPEDPDSGEAVKQLAARAETSTRTIYRILSGQTESVSLALADRLVLEVGRHLAEIGCRLRLPDGAVVEYGDA